MTGYTLEFAAPVDQRDCIAEPLLPLVAAPPWVAYLAFDGGYLADVNDTPGLEDEYDAGLALWAKVIQSLISTLEQSTGGTPVWISQEKRGAEWSVERSPGIDPDMVESMSSFGWPPSMWAALDQCPSGSMDLKAVASEGNLRWWLSHGYKEPFVVGHSPGLTSTGVAGLLAKQVDIPIELTQQLFVPHRVRVHRRYVRP